MLIPPAPPRPERTAKKATAFAGEYWAPEDDMSMADKIAFLSEVEREAILKGMDPEALLYDFTFWGRPSQLSAVNSKTWMTVCLAGRGWGKSRVLSEAIHKYAKDHPKSRLLLLGRTAAEVREVMVLGDSGVMAVANPADAPVYKPGTRQLIWPNGSTALCISAEKPDALRGQQFHASFCDEIGSYKQSSGSGLMDAFDQVKIATRLPGDIKIFVATTPRRVPIITNLVEQAEKEPHRIKLIRGSTMANRHLTADYMDIVSGMYNGTSLGRQELDGELLMDVEGALLSLDTIEDYRRDDLDGTDFWRHLPHRVIGVDPSITAKPGDLCGIVVVGATGEKRLHKRQAFVLEDASIQGSPAVWAKKVVEVARKYGAVVVAESNQGGEMVRMIIKEVDDRVPVTLVHAKVGKMERAQPVGAAYEQGRVHHTDFLSELEDQLTTWSPDQKKSPDRMDAAVWGLTSLLVEPPKDWIGKISISTHAAHQKLPDVRDTDPFRAAEPRKPRGAELDEIKRRLFDIDPADPYGTVRDAEEAGLRRRVIPSQRALVLPGAHSNHGRANPFAPPVRGIR